jgi:hypothetical protein
MKPGAVWLFGVLALAGGARAAAPDAVLPLEPYQDRQFALRAALHGHPGLFLFDTGEGMTMITPALAAAIGCVPWGNITALRMLGERLDTPRCDNVRFAMPGGPFTAEEAIIYDLGIIAGKDAPALQGAIGLDVFAGRIITIELAQHRLIVENAASLAARVRHATAVPVRIVRASDGASLEVFLGVATPRGTAWMELDTGNAGPTIFVSRAMAPLLGLDDANTAPKDAKRQPATLNFGPGIRFSGLARVFPGMVEDGNIGVQFLRNWDLTVDLAHARAWMAPVKQAASSSLNR